MRIVRAFLAGKLYWFIWLGIGLSILFLAADLMVDVFIFHEGDILEQIFAPSPYETFMRFSVVTIFLASSTYAHTVTQRLLANQSQLEQELAERKRAEQALRESEEKFRSFIEQSSEGMVLVDEHGKIIEWNHAEEQITGITRAQALGAAFWDIQYQILPRERRTERGADFFQKALANAFQTGQLPELGGSNEIVIRTVTGELKSILQAAFPIKTEDGYRIGALVRDVTQSKEAQERSQGQLRRLAALRVIDDAIAGSFDVALALNVVLEQTATQLSLDAACVLLLSPHSLTLTYAAGRGFRTDALKSTNLRLGEGYAGQAALERRVFNIPDLRERKTEFLRSPLFSAEGFVSYYAVPLIAKGQTEGVLEVFQRSLIRPDPEWLNFLETLAKQAAIAVDNARLFDGMQRANADLFLAYDNTIEGWSRALDLRDKETEGHTQRVTGMTVRVARAMGISEAEIVHVRRGALLHDIGKMGVPDAILLKPGNLTDDEWKTMRLHPALAYDMLAPIAYLRPALDIPYCHHEKWDGTGYPRGLKGEAIPLAARIFAVVDVWDALRSDRPYRAGWTEEKVLAHIRSLAGTHFDPKAVELFLRIAGETIDGQ